MTTQGDTQARKGNGTAGFIVLGLLITLVGVAGLVWHYGYSFTLIVGPVCLLAGLGKLASKHN